MGKPEGGLSRFWGRVSGWMETALILLLAIGIACAVLLAGCVGMGSGGEGMRAYSAGGEGGSAMWPQGNGSGGEGMRAGGNDTGAYAAGCETGAMGLGFSRGKYCLK